MPGLAWFWFSIPFELGDGFASRSFPALSQIANACVTVVLMSLAVGRPYGLYMVFCRKMLLKYTRVHSAPTE